MTRPSQNTDRRLIQAAKDLLPETGFSRLTLRDVAAKAGVNLGMFSYHFKNKREFVHRVMGEVYDEFFAKFNLEAATGETPVVRLRNAVRTLGRFTRDHRHLLTALAGDLMGGDRDTIRFIENNFGRHMRIVVRLMRQCRREGSLNLSIPMPLALVFMIAGVAAPHIMLSVIDRAPTGLPLTALKRAVAPMIVSDAAIEQRIEMAFTAISKPSGRPARGKRRLS